VGTVVDTNGEVLLDSKGSVLSVTRRTDRHHQHRRRESEV
jgi:hypothetical protein